MTCLLQEPIGFHHLMKWLGLVYSILNKRPLFLMMIPRRKMLALDVTTVNNGKSKESLFVTAWRDDALDDTEEYEVLFEEEDVTTGYLSCALIADCSNVGEEELVFQPDVSVLSIIQEWGATYDKMYGGLNVIQSGASKQEALNGIENGEQMFVVFNQRMLIAVLNSARVFDPGGQDKKMEKVNQNILVQQ